MKYTKRLLSALLTFCLLLGLLPTAAFASPQEEAAAMAAVEEGTLLNDTLSLTGKELPVIGEAEDEELSLTLSPPQPEEAPATLDAPSGDDQSAQLFASPAFTMATPTANQSYYYYGGDISGTIGASGANHGWSGRGRGNFNASVSGDGNSYTLTVAEKEKYKKSNIIYQPFTITMEVPAYSTKVVDLDLAVEGWRNSKGAASYYLELFFWGTGQDKAATTKFNVGETRNPTPGAATLTTGYRYFSDSKNGGKSTGTFSLSFSNVTAQKKTVTYNMGAYVGVNCSTSLLSSYHHTLDARFTFTATNVTQKSYAAAVNGKPYITLDDAIAAYNATTDAYLQVFMLHLRGNITLNKGGIVDLGGNAIHLYDNSTLDVRGGSGTTTLIANGTITSGGAAITHSGAGNLCLGTEDGKMATVVTGANTGVLNTGGPLILQEGVKLQGQEENAIKNTGSSNIYFQGTPTMQSGSGKANIDLGKGLIGLGKAITNKKPYTVYLPDYNASIDPPRRVTDVWSSKMGSADPENYFTISTPNVSPKPATLLHPLANGGNAVVARPLMLALRPNGGSGVPSYVTVAQGQAVGDLPTPTRKNYTFDGWFLNADRNQPVGSTTTFAADAVLTAGWSYTKYIIIIEMPDGTKSEQEIAPGETYGDSLPEPPEPPTGKEFDHWETSDGKKVDENTPVADTIDPETGNPKPLTPVYKSKTYTITFDYRMSNARPSTRRLEYGKSYGVLPTMARKGYTFQGWYTDETTGEQVTADTPIPAANHTLYAHWVANTSTVTFDANGGEGTVPPLTVTYGDTYAGLSNGKELSRQYYNFTGWATAPTGGTPIGENTQVTDPNNHTLYAQWSRDIYVIRYIVNDGIEGVIPSFTVAAGDPVGTALPTPTRPGYSFQGWYDDDSGELVTAETVPVPPGPATPIFYTARWTAVTYTIPVNGTDKTVTVKDPYSNILPTENPTREGYTFGGWQDEKGNPIAPTAKPDPNNIPKAITPKWTANTYAVTFNANGGSVGTSGKNVTFGQPYGTLPMPTKDGFNFMGWQDGSGRTVFASTPVSTAENHTLTAQWALQHKHKVNPNGGEGAVDFQALTAEMVNKAADTYYLPAGNYYLAEDITTANTISVDSNTTVNLCFNGHTINGNKSTAGKVSYIYVNENSTLTCCDCQGGGGYTSTGYNMPIMTGETGSTVNLYGGTFSSQTTSACLGASYSSDAAVYLVDGATLEAKGTAVRLSYGSLTVKSGTIASGSNSAIAVKTDDTVLIEGGTITGGTDDHGAVTVYDGGAITVSGGSITGSTYGIDCEYGRILLSGSPAIHGEKGDLLHLTGSTIDASGLAEGTVYSVKSNRTIISGQSIPFTAPADADYSAHFTAATEGEGLRDVVNSEGKHTVQLYKKHLHDGVEYENYIPFSPAANPTLVDGGHYLLTTNLSISGTGGATIPEGATVDLCLNGYTLSNGSFRVNGTLNLYDCKGSGRTGLVKNTNDSAINVASTGTLNYYGGTLEGGNEPDVPLFASGVVNLYATPTINTDCDYDIRGNTPDFLHIKAPLAKPTTPLRVNFGNAEAVNITTYKQVTVTTGWAEHMNDAEAADYFVPRLNRYGTVEQIGDELVLRLFRVDIDGVTHYPSYKAGTLTANDLAKPDSPAGYLWDGWYDPISNTKITTNYTFTSDATLQDRWTECDHSGHDGSVNKIDATCTTAEREQFTCSQCGLEVDRAVGDVPGHSYKDEWVTDSAAHWYVCSSCGAADPDSRAEHTFGEPVKTEADCTNSGSEVKTCTDCNYSVTAVYTALGHELTGWGSDENDHWNVCVREGCGMAATEHKAAHNWSEWHLTSAPQVNVPGEETAYCSDCGYAKTQAVEALPAPEYAVTYTVDEYTNEPAPTQADAVSGDTIPLPTGLTRTGYTLAGWTLLDQEGVPMVDEDGTEILYTGTFTMLGRDVVFRARWDRVPNYELKPGETIVLPDGTVIQNESGGTVTIDQGGDGEPETTITLPDGGSVTVQEGNEEEKDKVIAPPGSTVETNPGDGEKGPVITIGSGNGKVDLSGKVDAPVGTTIVDKDGNTITITEGTVDPDGVVIFPEGSEGTVTVTDKEGNETQVTVPGGGDGLDVTPGGKPIVNNPNGSLTVPDGQGGSTTITTPGDQTITDNGDGTYTVPGGSTIETGDGSTITLPDGGKVEEDGGVNLPDGGEVKVTDKDGNVTTITVPEGGSVNTDEEGNVVAPPGSTVTGPDGTTTELPNGGTVKPDGGTVEVKHNWGKWTLLEDGQTLQRVCQTNIQHVQTQTLAFAVEEGPFIYNGADQKPEVTLTADEAALTLGKDYSVDYQNNVNVGTAKLTVTGQGNYSFTLERSFSIGKGKVDPAALTPGSINIANRMKNEYVYTLTFLCPAVDGSWGERHYAIESVDFSKTGYYINGTARIDRVPGGDYANRLFLPILSNSTDFEGVVGTVTIRFSSDNYEDFTNIVRIVANNKSAVTFEGVEAPDKTYDGQSYAPKGTVVTRNKNSGYVVRADVEVLYTGRNDTSYSPADPHSPPIDAGEYAMTLRVRDTDLYYIGRDTYNFQITKAPGKGSVTMAGYTEGQTASQPVAVSQTNGTDHVSYLYKVAGTADGTYTPVKPTRAGTYTVKAIFAATRNYTEAIATTDFTVAKAAVPDDPNVLQPGQSIDLLGGGSVENQGEGKVEIIDKDGGKTTVTLPEGGDGTVKVDKDAGTVTVPGGSSVTTQDPSGTTTTVTVPEDSQDSAVKPGGEVTLPNGGKVEITDKDGNKTTVTVPEQGGTVKPTQDGKVELPEGATVTKPNGATVTVPSGGGIIDPVTGDVTPVKPDEPTPPKPTRPSSNRRPTRGEETKPEGPKASVEQFTDVKAEDWFYDSVKAVVEQGLMKGTSETTFAPSLDTSRAMIATILWRLAGEPEPKAGLTYSDCVADSWYSTAVAWASQEGVVKGYGNGDFGPDDPITREQLAVMLYRYAGSPAVNGALNSFTDSDKAGAWAIDALRWSVEQSILTGKGGGILDPTGQATRAEAATMLTRFLAREQ